MTRFCLVAVVALAGGCSKGDATVTYPVSGGVKFRDGTPANGITVKFRTVDRMPPYSASGKTDDQGQFRLDAAEGANTVVVVPSYPRDTDELTPAQRQRVMNPIDPVFLDFEQSPLKFQVTADEAQNRFEITVWPPRR